MSEFKQLRIRAHLQTGVISDQFLPLDGILYYHSVREKMGEQIFTTPGQSSIPEGQSIHLPFKKGGPRDNAWFYHCSFAQWPDHAVQDNTFFVKRFDLNYSGLIDGVKKIRTSAGKYKAYHLNVYYRHALYIDWYCVGIPDELNKLLPFCTHLGKKTTQGWGSVLKWELTEWPEDWSIRGPQNKLMRAVPVTGNGFLYGVRPSYWHPHHVFPCKMPE